MEYKFHKGDRVVVVDTTAGAHDMESHWLGEKGVVLSVDCSVRLITTLSVWFSLTVALHGGAARRRSTARRCRTSPT